MFGSSIKLVMTFGLLSHQHAVPRDKILTACVILKFASMELDFGKEGLHFVMLETCSNHIVLLKLYHEKSETCCYHTSMSE